MFDCYRGKDCMERFCEDLKEHATKITMKKELLPLTTKENKSYHEQNACYVCKIEFSTDHNNKIS